MLKRVRVAVSLLVLVLLAGAVGYKLGARQIGVEYRQGEGLQALHFYVPADKAGQVDFTLFWQVWNELSTKYIDKNKITAQQLLTGAIKGMTASLGDPYTVFLPPKDNLQSKEDLNGSFEGVGIQLGYLHDQLAVIAPLAGTPAEKAGVKAGDYIMSIDGEKTRGISLPEAVDKIRGPKGSTVTLGLFREGLEETTEYPIVRGTIVVPSVEAKVLSVSCEELEAPCQSQKQVAYIKLARFGELTKNQWLKAVSKVKSVQGNQTFAGVILDVRNNPGGLLASAVDLSQEFLKDGVVIVQQKRADGSVEVYRVERPGQLLQVPVVVLINQGSASASEIIAGALQRHGRAKLVGETSFGKGTVQEAEDLGRGAGLHITTAKWLLPDGDWIHGRGLTPDWEVKYRESTPAAKMMETQEALPPLADNQWRAAVRLLLGVAIPSPTPGLVPAN